MVQDRKFAGSCMLVVIQRHSLTPRCGLALDSRLRGNDNDSYRIGAHRQPGDPNVGIRS